MNLNSFTCIFENLSGHCGCGSCSCQSSKIVPSKIFMVGHPRNFYSSKISRYTVIIILHVVVNLKDVSGGGSESLSGGERGEEVREEVHTAWIPTPHTQLLLAQKQPTKDPAHLTCPALVADVRVVSKHLICKFQNV